MKGAQLATILAIVLFFLYCLQTLKNVNTEEPKTQPMGVLSQIPSVFLQVSTKASCEGGGTGQEFTRNLLVPGNGEGNKWYDPYSHGTWIKVSLKSPRAVTMFGLKSANDCPDRDPYNFSFYGVKENGEKILLETINALEFEDRYQFKFFSINNTEAFSTYLLDVTANLNVAQRNNWGTGTQLAEISLFEQTISH